MFEKFKNDDTDAEIPAVPKPEVKSFAQDIPLDASEEKVDTETEKSILFFNSDESPFSGDSDVIIEKIVANPEKSAEFKGCNSSIWNEVWKGVSEAKLHPRLSWDSDSGTIRYR